VLSSYKRYVESGEINSRVNDAQAVVAKIKASYESREGVSLDELDGLTIAGEGWWFNVRASNTEPLLRLNAEAKTQEHVQSIVDDVLLLIRG
jgi:phosphomannomutase